MDSHVLAWPQLKDLKKVEVIVLDGSFPEESVGPKSLENAPFVTKNASKMGPKRVFPKQLLDHLGCSNKCL